MQTHPFIIALALTIALPACKKNERNDPTTTGQTELPVEAAVEPPTHAELEQQIAAAMRQMLEVVKSVKDTETAETAATKLDAIATELQGVAEQLKTLDPPAAEFTAAAHERFESLSESLDQGMQEHFKSISELPKEGQQAFMKAMMEFSQKMSSVGREFNRHFRIGRSDRKAQPVETPKGE